MDKTIEVRYAGVVVGRSAIIRDLDTHGLFLGITEPMPVGTPVVLRIGDGTPGDGPVKDVPGKIETVVESQELAHAGMRVRFEDPRMAALFGTPGEAPVASVVRVVPVAASPAGPARAPTVPAREVPRPAAPEPAAASPVRPAASQPAPASPGRAAIDASLEKTRVGGDDSGGDGAGSTKDDDAEPSPTEGGDNDRIPAPDPSAFGSPGGGGRRGRRNRRR